MEQGEACGEHSNVHIAGCTVSAVVRVTVVMVDHSGSWWMVDSGQWITMDHGGSQCHGESCCYAYNLHIKQMVHVVSGTHTHSGWLVVSWQRDYRTDTDKQDTYKYEKLFNS